MVCISVFLALCSKSLQSTDWYPEGKNTHTKTHKPCVSVWLLVRVLLSSRRAVSLVTLKTDTRQRYGETEVVHMYRHDESTEARSQPRALATLCLSTYFHSHYTDEQNFKNVCADFIYTTAYYTYINHKNKPN